MKKGILILVLVCFAFLLSSCDENNVSVDTKTESTTTTTNQTTITTSKQKYEVSFIVNGEEHDSLECNGKEAITLPNEPVKTGYDFVGWFYEDTFTTEFKANSLVNNNINNDINVYAKLNIIDYAISYMNTKGVTHNNPTSYNVETNTITLTDLSKEGYEFDGWYNGNTKVTTIPKGSTANIVLEARWDEKLYIWDGNYIYFGEYPQTEVRNETIINVLDMSAGSLPTETDAQDWTSYGYYASGEVSNYMWYQDVTYDGEKYRGVYFTSYKTYDATMPNPTSAPEAIQISNGYNVSTDSITNIYWFKFEPIKWRLLDIENDEALLLCEMVIDSREFHTTNEERIIDNETVYANNWEYSTIRSWLNNNFYNTAFSNLQKEIIAIKTIDNITTAYTTGVTVTSQNNTSDKVYLLSYKDMINESYGFGSNDGNEGGINEKRQKVASDYAKAQGVYCLTTGAYIGKSPWFLRSADGSQVEEECYARLVAEDGKLVLTLVKYSYGIVPAINIKLSKEDKEKYTVSFYVDGNEYDNIKCNGMDTITLPINPRKTGYKLAGWYYEENFETVFVANSIDEKPLTEDIIVYGKWELATYTISYINTKGATNTNFATYKMTTETFTLSDLNKDGFEFDGWYSGNRKVTSIPKGSTDNLILEARWKEDTPLYIRENNYIYFGTYPQTEVTNTTITNALNTSAGSLPTKTDAKNWISYGYYASGEISNYMWYQDIIYENEKYRGVYYVNYRPYFADEPNPEKTNEAGQAGNGYLTSTDSITNIYWFRFDLVKWKILNEKSNEALLLCDMIIDNQEFNTVNDERTIGGKTVYANNWEYSAIRLWLNSTFYNTVFSALQKELIISQTLDNSTTASINTDICATSQNSTSDNVYLLSYVDVRNYEYGFAMDPWQNDGCDEARQRQVSDYACVQGCYRYQDLENYGNGTWMLRSSSGSAEREGIVYLLVEIIGPAGQINWASFAKSTWGIVPALTIRLN